ncbi:MAG: FtsX-like permease family protein, partial [Gemmatimonadota bacterium]|nr:FtsX-like permease family protein [Gemmatimonadota bacterium]
PDRSPVGERITLSFAGPPVSAEVVGVVGDVRHGALDTDPGPRIYIPHQQSPNGALLFAARTSVEPETLIESMKEGLWDVNAALSMGASYAFRELRAGAERERQFYAILLVAFAVVALSIAAVGVYGLGAYTVARQRPEIGIMLALGATPGRIARLFVARNGRLLALGLGLGLVTALALTRFLRGLLYGLSPTDPTTLAASLLGLGLIGLAATYVPARRASRTDPTEVLRTD